MNKEKFKQLSFSKKLQWLIQYYGVVTVVAVIAVIVIIFFLKSVFFPEPPADAIVMILSDFVTPEDAQAYQEILTEKTGEDVEVVSYLTIDAYGEASFVSKMSVDQVDLVIAPMAVTKQMMLSKTITEYTQIEGVDLCMSEPTDARLNEHSGEIKDFFVDVLTNYKG